MASLVFDQEDAEEQILAQALYVNEIDLVDDDEQERPPATGEEYLRKVVREAKKLQFSTTGNIFMLFLMNLSLGSKYFCSF